LGEIAGICRGISQGSGVALFHQRRRGADPGESFVVIDAHHFSTAHPHQCDERTIRAGIVNQHDPDFRCEVNCDRNDSGFETDSNSPLVTFLESVTAKKAGSVAYGTEGAQMTILGSEAVVLGPGDIREAHRTGEFVPVDELNRCVDILSQAIRHFCY